MMRWHFHNKTSAYTGSSVVPGAVLSKEPETNKVILMSNKILLNISSMVLTEFMCVVYRHNLRYICSCPKLVKHNFPLVFWVYEI